jgi:hypothetical protein
MNVHMCSQNPKPSSQIKTAKTNSSRGKKSEGAYKQYKQQQDQSTVTWGQYGLVTSHTSVAQVQYGHIQQCSMQERLFRGPRNMMYIPNHFFSFPQVTNKPYHRGKYGFYCGKYGFILE